MLTPKDLRNPKRKSGFDYVNRTGGDGWAQLPKPYNAMARRGRSSHGTLATAFLGPRRATAEEAAQDYCDWYNGLSVKPAPKLKSAGHAGKRQPMTDPEVQHALGVLRDAKAQREGRPGYVYLIVEELPGGALRYGKVGYSTNPEARVAELQTGNPRPLRLHLMKPGTLADESAIHARHIRHNVLQEWFLITRELLLEWDAEHQVRAAA